MVDADLGEKFPIGVGVRQGCVVSPRLFNIFMNGCMRDMKGEVENVGVMELVWWWWHACLPRVKSKLSGE